MQVYRKVRELARELPTYLAFFAASGLLTGSIMPDKNPVQDDSAYSTELTDMKHYTTVEKIVQGFSTSPTKKTKLDTTTKTGKIVSKENVSANGQRAVSNHNYANFSGFNQQPFSLTMDNSSYNLEALELASLISEWNAQWEIMGRPSTKDPKYKDFYAKVLASTEAFWKHYKDEEGWIALEKITHPELLQTGLGSGKNYQKFLLDVRKVQTPDGNLTPTQGYYKALICSKGPSCILIFNDGEQPQIKYFFGESDDKNTGSVIERVQSLVNLKGRSDKTKQLDIEPSYAFSFIKAAKNLEKLSNGSSAHYNSDLWAACWDILTTTPGIKYEDKQNQKRFTIQPGPDSKPITFVMTKNQKTGVWKTTWLGLNLSNFI